MKMGQKRKKNQGRMSLDVGSRHIASETMQATIKDLIRRRSGSLELSGVLNQYRCGVDPE
jgi:hypothetical protein